jgi:hypothetical protein
VVGHGAKNAISKNKLVMKDYKQPWTLTDSLDKQPKLKKMDMRMVHGMQEMMQGGED